MRVLRDWGNWDDVYVHIKLFDSLDDAIKKWKIMLKRDLIAIFYNDENRNTELGIENLLKEITLEHGWKLVVEDCYSIYYDPDKMNYSYYDYNDDYESHMDILDLPIT